MSKLISMPLCAIIVSGSVLADEVCFTVELPLQPTAWQQLIVLPPFSGPGVLECVSVTIDTHLEGSAGVENTAEDPSTTTVQWSARADIARQDTSILVGSSPFALLTDDLEAFDGDVDFGGASGNTHLGLTADASQTVYLGPGSQDFAQFLGPGPAIFLVTAAGTSTSSPGTSVSIAQQASATVTVCYIHDAIQSYCSSTPNSGGGAAVMTWTGTSSLTGAGLTLSAAPVPTNAFGLVVCSPDQDQLPLGNGLLCLGTDTLGFVVRLASVQEIGTGELTHAVSAASPANRSARFLPGSTWNFQMWFRDLAAGGAGFNFSDAVQVTFCP